ncbi:TetR/AcrR family transcriptional regulator [Coralliovum pocilloporae]|uniref:TetR/AcrR family transcriptional regulator n=1 Tax=Coralliovum pocilloporae TaxID=3066369 RepID=UPI0033072119
MSKTKRDDIVLAAEQMIRQGGYNAFSFRDIAEVVGIKSASVHYHFPSKAELGGEVARRYTERLMGALGEPEGLGLEEALDLYSDLFRTALLDDDMLCLCGMLGAETLSLPDIVRDESKAFFQRNISWLKSAFGAHMPASRAEQEALLVISTLEGAMILSRAMDDKCIFTTVATELKYRVLLADKT